MSFCSPAVPIWPVPCQKLGKLMASFQQIWQQGIHTYHQQALWKQCQWKKLFPPWLQEPPYTLEDPRRLCCSWSLLGQEVGRKKKYSPSYCLLMAVRKAISSSCSLLELRISLHFILATHSLFSVIKSKIICFTTALSLDNPSEFQVDTSGIDSQQAAMHMVCLKNQCRRQSDVDNPAVCYHLSIYLFL